MATAREARAGAGAREHQEARRAEMARIAGERFECPPPLLPEKLGFIEQEIGEATAKSATMDGLNAERERLARSIWSPKASLPSWRNRAP